MKIKSARDMLFRALYPGAYSHKCKFCGSKHKSIQRRVRCILKAYPELKKETNHDF